MKIKLTRLFLEFFQNEKSSGGVLIVCTIASIVLANSPHGPGYVDVWHTKLGFDLAGIFSMNLTVVHWINDGLMTIFFLMIGLEIERELYVGELSSLENASLPIVAAIGGMATPVLIHFLLNRGTDTQAGFAIPMATDIAFSLGVLALVGSRIPPALKVFLVAFAIIDDLGAILIIAIFYAKDVSLGYLGLSLAIFAGLLVLNRLRVRRLAFYLVPGVLMWYCMHESGIHATISGVLLAFAVPFHRDDRKSPSHYLQHALHWPVAFGIMPLFALANTGIALSGDLLQGLASPNSIGIIAGLLLGKPAGIVLCSLLAVKAGWSKLPGIATWRHIVGGAFLGGIGFTMSIFITLLAFDDPALIQGSKISILLGSLVSGIAGYLVLRGFGSRKPVPAGV